MTKRQNTTPLSDSDPVLTPENLSAAALSMYHALQDCRLAIANGVQMGLIDLAQAREFFRLKVDPALAIAEGKTTQTGGGDA